MSLEMKDLSLRDAIAYEFYMNNLINVLGNALEKDTSPEELIVKFAKICFIIADVFCETRNQPSELNLENHDDV